jgi:hypothetical protein
MPAADGIDSFMAICDRLVVSITYGCNRGVTDKTVIVHQQRGEDMPLVWRVRARVHRSFLVLFRLENKMHMLGFLAYGCHRCHVMSCHACSGLLGATFVVYYEL